MHPHLFGTLEDGTPVHEVVIGAPQGVQATIMEWGAVVRDLVAVSRKGGRQRVVLGLATLEDYVMRSPHMGAIAGRYANRIAGGRFAIDGVEYQAPLNQDGRHSLHGGGQGFGKRPWRIMHYDPDSVTLGLVSPDGDAGYPGALTATCRYSIADHAALRVELFATTTKATIVNLCQHSYFNLDGSDSILDHELTVDAGFYTPVDAELIPTGEILSVAGTPFDFREMRPIRLAGADGRPFAYYHNFVLARSIPTYKTHPQTTGPVSLPGLPLFRAAEMRSHVSGIAMQVWTTEPGVQVYDGHKVDVPVPGLGDRRYGANAGICFEPQRFPDSPNRAHFSPCILRPGEVYAQVTEYRFGRV